MKKPAILFILVLSLFSVFSPASGQDKVEYQTPYTTESYLAVVKSVVFSNAWQTVIEIYESATGVRNSVLLGENIYINEITGMEDGSLLLIGTGGDWYSSVVFRLDPTSPEYYSQLTLRNGEIILDYWTLPGGMYFTTTFYQESDKPPSRLVRFWDFYSSTATKIAAFSQTKQWTDLYFGYVEGVNTGPGLMTISGKNASTYRINGDVLAIVKSFKVNPKAGNIGFYISKDNEVEVWGEIWFTQSVK